MNQGDVFAFQPFDVTHHFGFGMVFIEYLVRQESGASSQFPGEGRHFRYIGYLLDARFGGDTEDIQQVIDICQSSRLVDADTYIAVVEIAEVRFLAHGDGLQLLGRHILR